MSIIDFPTGRSTFEQLPSCPDWCSGHPDFSVLDHTTDLDYFGDGGVTLTQRPGEKPVVSLIDFNINPVQHDLSTDAAIRLAYRLLRATDVALRWAEPTPITAAAQALGESLRRDED